MRIKLFPIIATMVALIFISTNSNAQLTLPPGFNQVLVAAGISGATTLTQAPDGRFFVAQQNGVLFVVKNGVKLSKPFISLNVSINGERGLLGVALDPAFASNQYIYLCYSLPDGSFNRVSRFTASGDTVVPGSEVTVMELDSLIANYHGGGHLDFGPDGKLYISAGENGRTYKAQQLDTYLGKILRINSDGSVPSDNPFPGPGKRDRVWAYGLRNPFTFSFQRGTGRMFLNDVGDVTWEEINEATTGGKNFGWALAEGNSNNPAFTNPFFTYQHGTTVDKGCAITGGTFFNPVSTNYPPEYNDKYFYIDYCGNWINMVSLTNPPVWSNFATNIANYSVGMLTGLDGNLYFVSRNNEALYKITYTAVPTPLVLTDPLSQIISVNHPVSFSVTSSGATPFTYQWRKGTTPINGATNMTYTIPSVAFSDSGNYNVVVTNSFGSTTSNNAHLTVIANQPPVASIDTPLVNTFYTAGEEIHFSGSAIDPEDGNLPDSLFEWIVEFHHNIHFHPGPNVADSVGSGSFVIPNTGEPAADVFYRIYLIVHDPNGSVDSAYVDVHPRTSTFTLNTQPSGFTINLDGSPFTTPYSVLGVEGMLRTIIAPISQLSGQTNWLFTNWDNGGLLMQTFATPVNDTVWVANFDTISLHYDLGSDTLVCIGDSITIDAGANYSSYVWTDGSVNRYLNIPTSSLGSDTIGVTVTDANGATGNDSINIFIDICDLIAPVLKDFVSMYPVPSLGEITISELQENYFLNVIDMTGRFIIKNDFVSAKQNKSIQLLPGIYTFLLMTADNQVINRKNVVVIR